MYAGCAVQAAANARAQTAEERNVKLAADLVCDPVCMFVQARVPVSCGRVRAHVCRCALLVPALFVGLI